MNYIFYIIFYIFYHVVMNKEDHKVRTFLRVCTLVLNKQQMETSQRRQVGGIIELRGPPRRLDAGVHGLGRAAARSFDRPVPVLLKSVSP